MREGGDSLSHDELVSIVALLLVAGHETTVNLIANGALALLRHPEHLAALRESPRAPELAEAVVEETLRYDPPVHITARVATEDMELSGVRLRRGAMVVLLLAAAHRDPGRPRSRTSSTRTAPRSSTWPSVSARTSAWAPRWPGWRPGWR
nr:hypothetical protein GCM10020093_072680 [Planobispora longispora]